MMNRSFRLRAVVAGLAVLAFARAGAQAVPPSRQQPDFTGTWVLDTVRSARDGVLNSLTLTVARSGDTLSVTSEGINAGGGFSTHAWYSLDGKPRTNSLGGVTLSSTVHWDGPVMVVSSTGDARGNSVTIDDRWSLDAAGQSLTRRSSFAVNGQTRSETLVFGRRRQS
jgi:hypothetical protein